MSRPPGDQAAHASRTLVGPWSYIIDAALPDGTPVQFLITRRPSDTFSTTAAETVLEKALKDAQAWQAAALEAPAYIEPVLDIQSTPAEVRVAFPKPRLTLCDIMLRGDQLSGFQVHYIGLGLMSSLRALETRCQRPGETPDPRAVFIEADARRRPLTRPSVRVARLAAPDPSKNSTQSQQRRLASVLHALATRGHFWNPPDTLSPGDTPALGRAESRLWSGVITGLRDGELSLVAARRRLRLSLLFCLLRWVGWKAPTAVTAPLLLWLLIFFSRGEVTPLFVFQTLRDGLRAQSPERILIPLMGSTEGQNFAEVLRRNTRNAVDGKLANERDTLRETINTLRPRIEPLRNWIQGITGTDAEKLSLLSEAKPFWEDGQGTPLDGTDPAAARAEATLNNLRIDKTKTASAVDALARLVLFQKEVKAALADAVSLPKRDTTPEDTPEAALQQWLDSQPSAAQALLNHRVSGGESTPFDWIKTRIAADLQSTSTGILNPRQPDSLPDDWPAGTLADFASRTKAAVKSLEALRALDQPRFGHPNLDDLARQFEGIIRTPSKEPAAVYHRIARWSTAAASYAFSAEAHARRSEMLDKVIAVRLTVDWLAQTDNSLYTPLSQVFTDLQTRAGQALDPAAPNALDTLSDLTPEAWSEQIKRLENDADQLRARSQDAADKFAAQLASAVQVMLATQRDAAKGLANARWAAERFSHPDAPIPDLGPTFRELADQAEAFLDLFISTAAAPEGTPPSDAFSTPAAARDLLTRSATWRQSLRDLPALNDGEADSPFLEMARGLAADWNKSRRTDSSAGPADPPAIFLALDEICNARTRASADLHRTTITWSALAEPDPRLDAALTLYAHLRSRGDDARLLVTTENIRLEQSRLLKRERLPESIKRHADRTLAARVARRLEADLTAPPMRADDGSLDALKAVEQARAAFSVLVPQAADWTTDMALRWAPPDSADLTDSATLCDAAWLLAALQLVSIATPENRDAVNQGIASLKAATNTTAEASPLRSIRDPLSRALNTTERFTARPKKAIIEELRGTGPGAAGWILLENQMVSDGHQEGAYIEFQSPSLEGDPAILAFILVKRESDLMQADRYIQATEFAVNHLRAMNTPGARVEESFKAVLKATENREIGGFDTNDDYQREHGSFRGTFVSTRRKGLNIQHTKLWTEMQKGGHLEEHTADAQAPTDWWQTETRQRSAATWPRGPIDPTFDHPLTFITLSAARHVAASLGCSLPSRQAWTDALRSKFARNERDAFVAMLNGRARDVPPNLADSSWRRRVIDAGNPAPRDAFLGLLKGAKWNAHSVDNADDNHIFLRIIPPPDRVRPGSSASRTPRFFDLIGNAAEWLDGPDPAAAGLSCMTPLDRQAFTAADNLDPNLLIVGANDTPAWVSPKEDFSVRIDGTPDKRLGDVGFRLSFPFKAEPDTVTEFIAAVKEAFAAAR